MRSPEEPCQPPMGMWCVRQIASCSGTQPTLPSPHLQKAKPRRELRSGLEDLLPLETCLYSFRRWPIWCSTEERLRTSFLHSQVLGTGGMHAAQGHMVSAAGGPATALGETQDPGDRMEKVITSRVTISGRVQPTLIVQKGCK